MGASLAVQSLGLRACIAGGTVRSLAGELKSLMLRDAATKKKKNQNERMGRADCEKGVIGRLGQLQAV